MSWFDQKFEYRIEEGDLRYEPSKIEGVRKDGGDFDDLYLQNLKAHLRASVFLPSIFNLYFETDELRRFVRIYIDSAKWPREKKGKADPTVVRYS
jgi:hypothetical protein